MDAFPFTKDEWAAVKDIAMAIVNATSREFEALHDHNFNRLKSVLNDLHVKYGDHPVLFETEADFTEDKTESTALYRKAASIAVQNGLPTFSIRKSLAQALADSGDATAALQELKLCEQELEGQDDFDRDDWHRLRAEYETAGGLTFPDAGTVS